MTASNTEQGNILWSKADLTDLANRATIALLAQEYLSITHPIHRKPDGFPLPVKKGKPAVDGTLTQEYRPIAVLEYVNDFLFSEAMAKRPKDRVNTGEF